MPDADVTSHLSIQEAPDDRAEPARPSLPWLKWPGADDDARSESYQWVATILTESAVLGGQLLTYKMAAHYLGTIGFSEYAIARRTISLVYPVALLGLAVALPRYIAHSTADESRSTRYFGAALWCLLATTALGAGLIACFRRAFAYLFFGSAGYAGLVFPLVLVMAALALHSVVYAYFRGHLALGKANVLQFLNLGIVPIAAIAAFGATVHATLIAIGVMTLSISIIGLSITGWRAALMSWPWKEAKGLLAYGVPRVPGDFALMGLLTLPATFVVHLRGVEEGGFMAFGTSLFSMVGSVFGPVGIILLPKASQMLAGGARDTLRQYVLRITKYTLFLALVFTAGFEFLGSPLLRLYLGSDFARIVVILRIVGAGILPYAMFYVLRGLIDAYHTKALNGLNSIVSLGVFLVASLPALVDPSARLISSAFVVGIFALGFLTIRETRRILDSRGGPYFS